MSKIITKSDAKEIMLHTEGTVYDLAHTVDVMYRAIEQLQDLARRAIEIHAEVNMDTPDDKGTHAQVIEALTENARLLGVKFS